VTRYVGTAVGAALVAALLAGCGTTARHGGTATPAGAEAISLLGDTLRAPALSDATRRAYEARLDTAARNAAANPDDPDALIWLGRRTAYLGRYRDAIAIFARGIEKFPRDARFYRHRGHRWISVREFARAADDLQRAAELVRGTPDQVEPDGLPNARGIPTSTLQSNVYYHLALAHYLRGDDERSLRSWADAMRVSTNPDMEIAARYWMYLTLRRMGRAAEAHALLQPVTPSLEIIENTSYHRLILVFKGDLPADSLMQTDSGLDGATVGFGLGAWLAAEGNRSQSEYFLRRARAGGQWAAFGYIAAEAALKRQEEAGRGR
jgi:tetratricopeptide (TPR) repeat protein